MVRVPGHPRATSGPYGFEHILVAEDLLGRYLQVGETVHHRNGVRDDNRPENLELWATPPSHPVFASATPSPGLTRSSNATSVMVHLQQSSH